MVVYFSIHFIFLKNKLVKFLKVKNIIEGFVCHLIFGKVK